MDVYDSIVHHYQAAIASERRYILKQSAYNNYCCYFLHLSYLLNSLFYLYLVFHGQHFLSFVALAITYLIDPASKWL